MSSPPSYTSRDDEKEKEREQDKERTSGDGDRKGNSPSKHREDDDKRSTKSRGSRKSHRSDSHHHHHHHHHRHHHDDDHKAEANGEGSSSSPKSDHDRKSTKSSKSHSRERRRSVHEYADDDKKSMKSSKSSSSRERPRSFHEQGGTSPMRALSESEVDRLARSRMRRSQYGPDFLRELAKNGIPAEFEQDGLPKFRVVTGHEARSIYNDVLGEDDHHASSSQGHDLRREGRTPSSARDRPVVFAFPVHPPNSTLRAGRKVVDYYMTWKGKTGTHRLKGRSRKNDFLDDDFESGFKKLAHAMDDVAKKRLSGVPKPVELEDPVPDTPRPPIISSQSAPAAPITTTKEEAEPLARPKITSQGSNASVLSLPYLGAPGVALRSPLHLRVTNPDPSSSSGTASKRTSLLEPEPKTPTGLGRKLSVVEEGDEPEKEKKHRRKHGHSSRRDTRSHSSDSISISSSESKKKKKEEILIVLMDSDQEKDQKAKWALQRVKRSNSARAPVRTASTRHSPWDGPVATSNGEVHRYVPGMSDQEDDNEETSDEDSDPDDNVLPIPNRTALLALGYHPQQYSASSPHLAPTPSPTLLSQATPAMSQAVLSPIYPANTPLYSSPHAYSTPNLPLTQAVPMPVPVTVPVGSPYVVPWPSSDYAPTPAQSIHSQLPPMDHPGTAGYTSPYVKPKQAPYLYSPAREPPLQIYATPSPKANLSRSVSGSGAGGAHIALPPPSIYVNSPYLRPESAHVLL